jgi:hypothetical protein
VGVGGRRCALYVVYIVWCSGGGVGRQVVPIHSGWQAHRADPHCMPPGPAAASGQSAATPQHGCSVVSLFCRPLLWFLVDGC